MPDKGLFDIHCHIVPSVDDGASSAEEAYKMLQMEYRQGVRNIIATPHYRLQMFETPIKTVEHQFLVLKQLARKVAPDLHVYLGCEFHSNMEMGYATDLHRGALLGTAVVLFVFILLINLSFSALRKGNAK